MKKLIALLLALVMVIGLVACGAEKAPVEEAPNEEAPVEEAPVEEAPVEEAPVEEAPVEEAPAAMTYADYIAAELESEVVIECYVQNHQSWWDNQITVYAADQDGAYFIYNMVCSEEDAAKLVPGTKIRVTGFKTEWAGEVEIAEGATFEFVEGADTYIAEPVDATALLGTDELINYQNQLATFKGMTVEAISYKNDGGDDIYLTLSLNGTPYEFCVEVYLTGTESDVYTTVGTLEVGNVVDVEGFLYWYEGVNPHITAIAIAE